MMMSQLAQVLQLAIAWLSDPQEQPPGENCNTPVTPMEQNSFDDQVCDATAVQCISPTIPAEHVCSMLACAASFDSWIMLVALQTARLGPREDLTFMQ
jgi:hypothetical protein